MPKSIDNLRVYSERPLITPNKLLAELPLSPSAAAKIHAARSSVCNIIRGEDRRLLVVVGPCSIHDCDAALEYALLLKAAAEQYAEDLFIVMRTYLEKPRTVVGWKGLISDPLLDGSFDINQGLKVARKLLLDLSEMNLPTATEFLDTNIPQYLSDLITWVAIGARTTESQVHRELASGLSMPVGFKNTTDGNFKIAIDAVLTARNPHHFLGIAYDGVTSILSTKGNQDCHIVLRGSNQASNYTQDDIILAATMLEAGNLPPRLMIDCSHGNSMKDHQRQSHVVDSIAQQLKNGSTNILGVMIESNLVSGKQILHSNQDLVYGQSITDACLSWDETLPLLDKLALAISKNRNVN